MASSARQLGTVVTAANGAPITAANLDDCLSTIQDALQQHGVVVIRMCRGSRARACTALRRSTGRWGFTSANHRTSFRRHCQGC